MDTGLSGFIKNLPIEKRAVKHIEEISDKVFVFHFERHHDFLPGQVVGVTIDKSIPPRLYSICSGKDEQELSILFNVKEEGLLTPMLAGLQAGEEVYISRPFGAFLGDEKPAWWIASGTGVAPYRSMLRSGLGAGKKLIHGGRTADSFYFENEMKAALSENYIRCCSQEQGEGLFPGRLTQWMRDQDEIDLGLQFYLCGSAEMVVEVRDILISKGVGIENIMSEIYF